MIDRINLDDGFVRYEIGNGREGGTKHRCHHLVCRKCGRVISFQAMDHEVKLYGYCKECGGKTG